jgi:hypothetical protein
MGERNDLADPPTGYVDAFPDDSVYVSKSSVYIIVNNME